MKKLLTLFAFICAFSLNAATGNAEVKLQLIESYTSSHYGIYEEHRNVTVLVKNLAYEKKLTLWTELEDGSWDDATGTAQYVGVSADGYEIWTINAYYSSYYYGDKPKAWGDEFAVKYTVNDSTYWDNNGGSNYKVGKTDGEYLSTDLNVLKKTAFAYKNSYADNTSFYGTIIVRNIAYSKSVKVIYTTDGWQTKNELNASFDSSRTFPYGSTVIYPNVNNVESWSFSTTLAGTGIASIEYAVCYEVNGTTYWDNNNGVNYTISFQ